MRIAPAALAALFLIAVSSAGMLNLQAADAGKPITVALLPKKKGLAYFSACAKGAELAAKELGNVELIYDGPTDGSPEKAAAMIEKWALKGVDVIAVSPNDPSVLAPAMQAARAKGVRVITWDSDAAPATREFFVNQGTSQQIAEAMVEAMVKDMGTDEGQVAIVMATLTSANQVEWAKYMKEHIAAKHPKLEVVAMKPTNEDQKIAFQVSQDLMKTYPALKGLFGISSTSFPGAAEAVKQAGKAGQVQVTGLATPNSMKGYVKDGVVKSVVLWNTADLGYLTVYAARGLVDGTLKAGAATFTAGKLGARTLAGDNVLLGNLLVFTKDNIDQFDF